MISADLNCIHGCLAGGAIGDSLGLPYEGLSANGGIRLLGPPIPNKLIWGYGLVSDDTEHACLTAISLTKSHFNPDLFGSQLASCLKLWFLCLPPATGIATAKACLKLILGVNHKLSGVFSAGNGPAMRAAVIGCSVEDQILIKSLIGVSTAITHRDQRSNDGALLIALAANWCRYSQGLNPESFFHFVEDNLAVPSDKIFAEKYTILRESLQSGEKTKDFADTIGMSNGVSGFIIPTTLIALHAWLSNLESFTDVITTCIFCGGDTDTVAAIAGALSGAYLGYQRLPTHLGERIIDYPFSYSRLADLATRLGSPDPSHSRPDWIGYRWIILPIRNMVFVAIILLHAVRRLATLSPTKEDLR